MEFIRTLSSGAGWIVLLEGLVVIGAPVMGALPLPSAGLHRAVRLAWRQHERRATDLMETLVNVTIPVFGIVLTGYLAGRFGILGEASAGAVNAFVYYFALPALLFFFTAQASPAELGNLPFIAVFLTGTAVVMAIAAIGGRLLFGLPVAALTTHTMTAGFANTAYMGIPIFLTAFGKDGTLPAIVATIAANTLVIGIGIGLLEFGSRREDGEGGRLGATFKALARNPLLIAPIAGLVVAGLGVGIPLPVANYLDLLGSAAGPSALFALGLALSAQALRIKWSEVLWLSALKLVVQPLVTLALILHVWPLDDAWMAGALILSALPTGALVYVVAQRYGSYVQEASATIVVSTAISVATVSGVLIALGIP